MGILTNAKNFLEKKTIAVAKKAADGIAATSALSPKQVEAVDEKRRNYLAQKPDMDSEEVQKTIQNNLGAIGVEVYQDYLSLLKKIYAPMDTAIENFDALNRIRYFDITKWVTDAEEQNLDRLVNVYQVLSKEECNIALIYHRTIEKCEVTLGVVSTNPDQADPSRVMMYDERLKKAIRGNFPGVEIHGNQGKADPFGLGIPQTLESCVEEKAVQSVAIVSNLASEKSKDFISQSMDKLLDGIIPQNEKEEYTLVLLAKPINDQLERKNRLYEMSSTLAPYASWQKNYTYSESDVTNSSANFGANLGASVGAQTSVGKTTGTNTPRLNENAKRGEPTNKTGIGKGVQNTLKQVVGMYAPVMDTQSATNTTGMQAGANFGVSFARASSVTAQVGKNEGITQTYTNYAIQHTLEVLEEQVKRMEESSALGMCEFAAYVTSRSPVVANNVAQMYLALTQGDQSYMTSSAVNLWDGEETPEQARTILQNVQKLQHPVFGLKDTLDEEWLLYPTLVTPSAILSGKELAKSLNFPRKSVSGLPVLQSAAFGREVQREEISGTREKAGRAISIGQIYHMRSVEKSRVDLDVDSLASHTFITGSTGAGKSNVIYQMLSKLQEKGVKYLVIEPAKGEYKRVFGKNCNVYGTNGLKSKLLQINPFSFPDGIHVQEHIDRLLEIFNACWPMYAAMPAVLKAAVVKSYENVGWNVNNSKCAQGVFPTMADLLDALPQVVNTSLYSANTKSDYAGALITRVQSLANGINGQIFCAQKEVPLETLFEQNTIIDLSRVGSTETKSLLMGILVMKLQEYRMNLEKMNEHLIHVTVLEEAHNLLRKTSVSQSQESSNLQGKSVEMLTNSIAEMRTYGEGFIIADQAPDLLDEAVIQNTNTKIALRLPNAADRKLVGSSMVLNDAQIEELAKLPRGVAAVYQNDWIGTVLCHFDKYCDFQPLEYHPQEEESVMEHYLKLVFGVKDDYELTAEDADQIMEWIRHLKVSQETKLLLQKPLDKKTLNPLNRQTIAYNLFDGKETALLLEAERDTKQGMKKVKAKIRATVGVEDEILVEECRRALMGAIFRNLHNGELRQRYAKVEQEGRIL